MPLATLRRTLQTCIIVWALLAALNPLTTLASAPPAPLNRADRRASAALQQADLRTQARQLELLRQKLQLREARRRLRGERIRVKSALAHSRRVEIHGSDDFMRFRLRFLSHKMRGRDGRFIAPAPAHFELTGDLVMLGRRQSAIDHLTGAYSRGFAKSTIGTEDFALWLACGCPDASGRPTITRPENIVIVGASSEEREYRTRLANIIAEIDGNEALLAAFPGIFPARDKKGGWVCNTDSAIVLSNGTRIACMPFNGNIRGQSYRGIRPSFVLLDDPETRKLVRSPEQLQAAKRWFEEDLLGAEGGEAMSIVWLGTFLSYDCILRWLQQPTEQGGKGWSGPRAVAHLVPLLDDQEESNWPAYFTAERIARIRKRHGERAFAIERQLKVRPEEDAVFQREWFMRHAYSKAGLKRGPAGWTLYGDKLELFQRVDPASGKYKDKGDWFVVATVGINPASEDIYLLGLHASRTPLKGQIDTCISEYDRWQPKVQEIETVAMQVWLAQGVLERRALRIREVDGTLKNKHERIEAFSIHPENGKFHLDPDDPEHMALIDQAEAYPLAKYNDLLDAVSGATETALAHYKRSSSRSSRSSDRGGGRASPGSGRHAARAV